MSPYSTYYHRNLPHWQPAGAIFFVTFGLHGSLPVSVQQRLKDEAARLKHMFGECDQQSPEVAAAWKRLFKYADDNFDASQKALYLNLPDAAKAVHEAIMAQQDKGHFILHRYCIMPNHVHLLIEPLPEGITAMPEGHTPEWPPFFYTKPGREVLCMGRKPEELKWRKLWTLMKAIKGETAHPVAKAAGVQGKIWLAESWDHWIRHGEEYNRVIDYIDQNPVKAGLCGTPSHWRWSSAARPSATSSAE